MIRPKASDELVVVLGRFKPIGEKCAHSGQMRLCERYAALLDEDGHPLCQTVRLERIVQLFVPGG